MMGPAEYEALQKAITHTMLWLQRGDDAAGADSEALLLEIVRAEMAENPRWEFEALLGLQQLATILLVKLENATGASPEATLQDVARRYRPSA